MLIANWYIKIVLKINASKCRVMTFTRSRIPTFYDYYISGMKNLQVVDDLVYLGFKLSRALSQLFGNYF